MKEPVEVARVIELLQRTHGKGVENWHTVQAPFKVLIGTILSQRTKDEKTDNAAKRLFSRYKTAKQIAKAPIEEIEQLIRSSGFYKIKAKRIKEVSRIIFEKYDNTVPQNIEELIKLPGVGYKTGACVIVYGFGYSDIPVDVHVARISQRVGLTVEKNPDKIRSDLMKKIPKEYWIVINRLFVKHGKTMCVSRNPKCKICPITHYCNYYRDVYEKSS